MYLPTPTQINKCAWACIVFLHYVAKYMLILAGTKVGVFLSAHARRPEALRNGRSNEEGEIPHNPITVD